MFSTYFTEDQLHINRLFIIFHIKYNLNNLQLLANLQHHMIILHNHFLNETENGHVMLPSPDANPWLSLGGLKS